MVLLVAMIGAIVLTFRTRDGIKKQDPGAQAARRREDAVEVVEVKTGQGISRGARTMDIALGHYLVPVAAAPFAIGMAGIFLNRKNMSLLF